MFSKKLLIPLLSLSLLVTPAYSSHAAENAEAAGTSVEGQGMLSPSSSSESSESVFNGSGAGTSSEPVTDEKLETILKQVQSQLPAENGTWAVFISDLVNGTEGSLNDQKMQAASLIKLYIMGAVYENYDQITGQYGRDSVDSNLYSMITVSDNDAANTLTTYLGGGDSAAGMQAVNRIYPATPMPLICLICSRHRHAVTKFPHSFRKESKPQIKPENLTTWKMMPESSMIPKMT